MIKRSNITLLTMLTMVILKTYNGYIKQIMPIWLRDFKQPYNYLYFHVCQDTLKKALGSTSIEMECSIKTRQ